jgi:phosphate starvation-inducible PhoH-like protein
MSDMQPQDPAPKARGKESVSVRIDNTRHLADICGSHDRHLAMIEHAFDVYVVPRGNELCITGGRRAVHSAEAVIDEIVSRLNKGLNVGEAEVSAAIRMGTGSDAAGVKGSTTSEQHQIRTQKRVISPRSAGQAVYIDALRGHDLVVGLGPAGTGKTYLAVALAAAMLERGDVERIILSRPAVEAGERLGFLPGDMKEKVDPYLRPLYDALYDMMPAEKVERGLASGVIEVAPLAFMRGRTLGNAVIILDEAQNTTPMQMKMFLTRLGENSRMIVTGDPSQIDLPPGQASGLIEAIRLLDGVAGIAQVRFTSADVVRHPLVARIVEAYDAAGRNEAGRRA